MANEPGGDAASAGDLVSALLGGALGRGLAPAARAARAWYAANGDRERAHTTGVWLNKPGRAVADPVLVVAVDSGLLAGELGTNKDLYLARMAARGVRLSDIRFNVAKGTRPSSPPGTAARAERQPRKDLAPLSPAELERVARACAGLPDGLRQSVSRAMCASLRRIKSENT